MAIKIAGTTVIDDSRNITNLGSALTVAQGGTGLTSLSSGITTFLGTASSANLRAALTDETGTGSAVFSTSPALTTPKITTAIQNASAQNVIAMDSNQFFSGAFSDEVTALGNTGTAKTINLSLGNVFTATLTGNCTFTLGTANSTSDRATSFTLILTNDGTADRTVAWAGGSFKFPGGASELSRTTEANGVDVWVFFSPDGGSTWYGNVGMKDAKA
jgi:hypothetical protein